MSHPAWGEWIEIGKSSRVRPSQTGLTPHGVSGLKLSAAVDLFTALSLTPHGVSGLKLRDNRAVCQIVKSHPAWGEWIEILTLFAT